jgi:hypothetical protein
MSTLYELREIRDRLRFVKDSLYPKDAAIEREVNDAIKHVQAAIEEAIKSLNPNPKP